MSALSNLNARWRFFELYEERLTTRTLILPLFDLNSASTRSRKHLLPLWGLLSRLHPARCELLEYSTHPSYGVDVILF